MSNNDNEQDSDIPSEVYWCGFMVDTYLQPNGLLGFDYRGINTKFGISRESAIELIEIFNYVFDLNNYKDMKNEKDG